MTKLVKLGDAITLQKNVPFSGKRAVLVAKVLPNYRVVHLIGKAL